VTPQSSGFVRCDVGNERFAFQGAAVRLVARAEQIAAARGSDGRLGILRHAETSAPVYSLGALLGRSDGRVHAASHVVVVAGTRGTFGVAVDRAARAGVAEHFDVLPLPPFVGADACRWFAGLLLGTESSCLLLSPDGVDPGAPQGTGARAVDPRPTAARSSQSVASTIVASFTSPALPPCDADRYGLSARRLAAVVQTLPRIPLPGSGAFVTGLSWWQGTAVPLLDFREPARRAEGSRHLVVRTRTGAHAALPVGSEIALRRATREDVRVRSGESGFVAGVFAVGSGRVALIDVDALVASAATAGSTLAACVS
jgi:chemotaxis signal transduction protein